MKKINMKKLIIFAMLLITISIIAISNITSTADTGNVTLNFNKFGKSYTKTAKEWRINYTEPTIIEKEADGSCYIIWAVNDPPKTNGTYYSTIGYRIHTEPASGSGNRINFGGEAGKRKLVNSFEKYGVESEMGRVVTVMENGGNFQSLDKKQLDNGENYFFRMIKLTSADMNELGYTSGPLYFSGIMRNYRNGRIITDNAKTYMEWSKDGAHNLVTSSGTRKGYSLTSGGDITYDCLVGIPVNAPYIYVINNHYDRVINTDKAVENRNVKVKIYINGEEKIDRAMTEVKILNGTEVKVTDNNKMITLDVSGREKQQQVSPVAEGYEFEKAELDEALYTLGDIKRVEDKDRIFNIYYKGEAKQKTNTTVYYIKDGTNYRDSSNYLKDPLVITGIEANTEQYINVLQALTKEGKSYEFVRARTEGQENVMTTYCSIYPYTSGKNGTEIVIEYVEKPITGEEKEIDYTDESLSAFAYGHILQDTLADGGKAYNVQKGIPTKRNIYSHAQANGYLYKIKGKLITGQKPHEVIYYSKTIDESTGFVSLVTRTGFVKNEYSFFTIDQYEILELDEMYITNNILNGKQNIFEIEGHLTIEKTDNVGSMLPSEERYRRYVTRSIESKNAEEFELGEYIKTITDHNEAKANDLDQKKLEQINRNLPEEEKLTRLPEEEKTIYPKYKISDFSHPDSTFYVLEDTENVKLDERTAEAAAKFRVEAGLIEECDYIKVTAPSLSGNMSTEGRESYIKPETNFALLKYDLSDIYISSTIADDYESGRELSWIERIFKFIVDVTKEVIEFIKDTWNEFWKKIRGEGENNPPIIEEVVKEYNEAMDRYNTLPRDVYRINAHQDSQYIENTLKNGMYETTASGVTYREAYKNAELISEEIKNNPQQMNGLTVLSDRDSYNTFKNMLIPEGFYIAEKVNNVYVHTPIFVNATLKSISDKKTQYIKEDDVDYNVVQIGEKYKIELTTNGQHRNILGYGSRNYREFVKDGNAQIRFPYDMYVSIGSGSEQLFRGNTWYDIGNASNITIKIPEWAEVPPEETEKFDGVVYYDIRVSAINEPEGSDPVELGWENANYDSGNEYRKIYDDIPKDYRAHTRIPIYAVGKIYDFRVNFTNDQQYINTYNSGKMKDLSGEYKDDGFSIENLPIGKEGTNNANPNYTKAVKLGNKFKFNVKTLGWKTNNVTITPSFYFIPKNTSERHKVDVWYQDTNTGKYVKLASDSKYKLDITLPYVSSQIPNSTQRVTEPGPDSARVSATNKVKDAYSTGYLYQFAPSYLDRITSAKKTGIGNLGQIALDEEERFRLPSSTNDLKEMASNSIWYGEYKLPSTSKFVKSGEKFADENILTRTKNGDGFILVCFNIIGKYNDYDYLSYQKILKGTNTQWSEEGYKNSNIKLVNGQTYNLPGGPSEHVGVFLYEAFENNGEDVVNPH